MILLTATLLTCAPPISDSFIPAKQEICIEVEVKEEKPKKVWELSSPLPGKLTVTGDFGPRVPFMLPDGRMTLDFHFGTDFRAPEGTDLLSAVNGTVEFVGWDYSSYGGGWVLHIKGGKGDVYYLHMKDKSPLKVGDKVKQGQKVGQTGSTGASTAPHLHMEYHRNGKPVDPMKYLKQE